jgi:hypothetical protein
MAKPLCQGRPKQAIVAAKWCKSRRRGDNARQFARPDNRTGRR